MNKIITCEECGIDYYSETIVSRESFRHVFPDIVKLETELEKANKLLLKTNQVHIENQQLQKDLDGEREINQRLTDELAEALAKLDSKQDIVDQLRLDSEIYCDRLKEARAEIERLKTEAGKWRAEAKSKNDARLNLESAAESIKYWTKQAFQKDKLIEQMREALKGANKHFDRNYWNVKNDPDFEDLNEIWSNIKAALVAERGG